MGDLAGLEQHFGGLEATRQYVRSQPNWQQLPAEYLRKLESNRIFSTLVYPNALAGAMVLLLPMGLTGLWRLSARLSVVTRWTLVGVLGLSGLGCLYWSGSKSGWLIALVMGLVAFLRLKLRRAAKVWIVGAVLVVGLAGSSSSSLLTSSAGDECGRTVRLLAGRSANCPSNPPGTAGNLSVGYARSKPPIGDDAAHAQRLPGTGVRFRLGRVSELHGLCARLRRAALPEGEDDGLALVHDLDGRLCLGAARAGRVRALHPGFGLAGVCVLGLAVGRRPGPEWHRQPSGGSVRSGVRKTILFLNGPNLNLLGQREPETYGRTTLAAIEAKVRKRAQQMGWKSTPPDELEGELVNWIQEVKGSSTRSCSTQPVTPPRRHPGCHRGTGVPPSKCT